MHSKEHLTEVGLPTIDAGKLAVAEHTMETIKAYYDGVLPNWRTYEELYTLVHQQPCVPYRFEQSIADGFRKTTILDFDSNGALSITEESIPIDFADKPETTEQLQYIVQPDGFAVKFEEDEYGVPQAQVVDAKLLGSILTYANQELINKNRELSKKHHSQLQDERDRAYALERAKKKRKFQVRAAVGLLACAGFSGAVAVDYNNYVIDNTQAIAIEQGQVASDDKTALEDYMASLGTECAATIAEFLDGKPGEDMKTAEAETVVANYDTCDGKILPVKNARTLEGDYLWAEYVSQQAHDAAIDRDSAGHRIFTTIPAVGLAAMIYVWGWFVRYERKIVFPY